MAAGHLTLGVSMPTLLVLFLLWLSCPKLEIKYNVASSNRLTQARRSHVAYRIRFAITKWTKHGETVLSLPEVQSCIDFPLNYLLCSGDIHPHPGPSASESLTLKQKISISSSRLSKPTVNYSKSKSHRHCSFECALIDMP